MVDSLRSRSKLAEVVFKDDSTVVLSAYLGFYLLWYAVVENFLTTALALILEQPSIPKFAIIARGMDARVKVHRLREACRHFAPMGPNMNARLEYFERRCIDLRNQLVHSWPILESDGAVHMMQGGRRPPRFQAGPDTQDADKFTAAPAVPLEQLLEWGAWLNLFAQDVSRALDDLKTTKKFEIVAPESNLPEASRQRSQGKSLPAKPRRRKRKRAESNGAEKR